MSWLPWPATFRTSAPSGAPTPAGPGEKRSDQRPSAAPLQCGAVDIEEFYDADPRRRRSAEVELGEDWHDSHGVRYELSWVEDTGELYVMREPAPSGWATPFGGIHARGAHSTDEQEVEGMVIDVVASIPSRQRLDEVLAGWEDAESSPDGIGWLVERLRADNLLSSSVTP